VIRRGWPLLGEWSENFSICPNVSFRRIGSHYVRALRDEPISGNKGKLAANKHLGGIRPAERLSGTRIAPVNLCAVGRI
jgi:hypothetical protein